MYVCFFHPVECDERRLFFGERVYWNVFIDFADNVILCQMYRLSRGDLIVGCALTPNNSRAFMLDQHEKKTHALLINFISMCIYQISHLFIVNKMPFRSSNWIFADSLQWNEDRALTSTGLLLIWPLHFSHIDKKMRKLLFFYLIHHIVRRVRRFPPISMESFIDDGANQFKFHFPITHAPTS